MAEGDSEDVDQSWVERSPEDDEERRRRRQERREEHQRKVRRRRRRRRVLIGTAAALATLLVLGAAWFWWTFGGLERMPRSVGQTGAAAPGTTILLVGSDPGKVAPGRSARVGWRDDVVRSDLVMLLHLTADHRALYAISIPRDSVVQVPGVGPGTLSDAATAGGPRLVARTVEELTGTRLDRMAVLDLNAFREIADVLDGVVVDVPRAACGLPAGPPRDEGPAARHDNAALLMAAHGVAPGVVVDGRRAAGGRPPRPRRLDGQAALDYIALQPCFPRKDLDRVERQQSLVKALMRGAVDGGKLTHPLAVTRMLRAAAGHLALEEGFSYREMLGTLWSMRHLRTSNTTFLTVPVAAQPLARQDGNDYVLLDEKQDAELWTALRQDRLAEYLALHDDAAVLGR